MRNIGRILFLFLLLSFKISWSQTTVALDSGFSACLADKYSSLLDVNKELIIAKAQAHTGFLSCIGTGIKNIEGFQYFTKVTDVNFSRNSIAVIDNLPKNDSLTRLVLDDNQLVSLSSLNNVPQLKTLTVKRNKLTSLPDLSLNTKITQLYVQSNQITEILDLNKQKELWAVNFSSNLLKSLPNLDSLGKLTELVVSNNQLTELKSLEKLKSLMLIDASKNQLTSFPKVAPTNLIETINLQNNNFAVLPDFSVFSKLKTANLNDNYFTFEQLQALTQLPNYQSIFPLTSQKIIEVGTTQTIKISDVAYIKTARDINLGNVVYTWYYNNVKQVSSLKDSLQVFSGSELESGIYKCELTSALFPNLVLKTDDFSVTVLPCFSLDAIVLEVSPRTCINNGGEIKLITSTSNPVGFVYQLEAVLTKEKMLSSEGVFKNLGNNQYVLTGKLPYCEKVINELIEIKEQECLDVYITADGDGNNDEYYFNEQGRVKIMDKFGNQVVEMALPNKWNACGKNGLLPQGLYYASINDGEKVVKITVVH